MAIWGGTGDDVTLENVKRLYPDLAVWQGVSGSYYAGREGTTGPPFAEGYRPRDLLDDLRRAEAEEAATWRARCEALGSG